MSNTNAVAVATEGLKATLARAFAEVGTAGVAGAGVGTARPHEIPTEFVGVNVFLYQVTPNAALRGFDLPTRRASGELAQRPQLALDLHYILSFKGAEAALDPQRMMGAALAGLHARPELAPEDIELIAQNAPPGTYLQDANDLAQQVERVRFTLAPLNLEELSRLWAMFPQAPYLLSATVRASVVLLEAPLVPSPARPVERRGIYSNTATPPSLRAVSPLVTPREVGGARARLTLDGEALLGAGTTALFDDLPPAPPSSVADGRVVVALPDALRAGVHTVRVRVAHPFDDAGAVRTFELDTEALPFALTPSLTLASATVPLLGVVNVTVAPPVARTQRLRLIVGRHSLPWTWPPPAFGDPTEFTSFSFTLPAEVGRGRHPVRLEVDGAASPLTNPPEPWPAGAVPSPFLEVT